MELQLRKTSSRKTMWTCLNFLAYSPINIIHIPLVLFKLDTPQIIRHLFPLVSVPLPPHISTMHLLGWNLTQSLRLITNIPWRFLLWTSCVLLYLLHLTHHYKYFCLFVCFTSPMSPLKVELLSTKKRACLLQSRC